MTGAAGDRGPVRVERDGRVAWVIIDGPENHNPVSTAVNVALVRAFAELDGDSSVGCVVLRGAGERSFSAGADLREVAGRTHEEYRAEFQTIVDVFAAMRALRKPLIAAVRGYALGGGLGLVAGADLAVAGDDAVFGTPEITIGRFPFIISTVIRRAIGARKTAELAYTGQRYDGRQALEMGLVNLVVPAGEVWSRAQELAERIASYSPDVLAMGKSALVSAEDLEFAPAVDLMRDKLALNALMDDSQEGVTAFLEKRRPVWRSAR